MTVLRLEFECSKAELCEWKTNVNKWIYKADFFNTYHRDYFISLPPYMWKRVKASRWALRRRYSNKKANRKSSFLKYYFLSVNLPKYSGFPPLLKFNDHQEATFLLPPADYSIYSLNHEHKSTVLVFMLVFLPWICKNISPEKQISISKTTMIKILLKRQQP